jgi:hypothetical protein
MSEAEDYLKNLHPVKVLKFTGDRKSGTTDTGKMVHRQKELYMGKEYGTVHCAEYSSNFIYHDPDFNPKTGQWPKGEKFVGRFTPLCSCGSFAVITGANPYREDRLPTNGKESTRAGQMLVCWHDATYGVHADGSHD